MERWSTAPIVETTLNELNQFNDGEEIIKVVARVSRTMREEFGDIVYVLLSAAP